MSKIPDITETEEWIVKTTLKERYGSDPDLQYADAEIRLNPPTRTPRVSPTARPKRPISRLGIPGK